MRSVPGLQAQIPAAREDSMEREIYWNITTPEVVMMYVSFLVAFVIFAWGVWNRVRYWRIGKPMDEPWSDWGRRAKVMLKETILQTGVLREWYPGLFHGLIFFSFLWLMLTTATVFVHADFGLHLFQGPVYLILSLGADIGGVLVMIGILMAAWRRYVVKPDHLDRKGADAFALIFLALIILTGYLVEGSRIAFTQEEYYQFSPVGYALSFPFAGLGESAIRGIHRASWWVHMVGAMAFIACIPYTKFFHLVSLPTNVFFMNLSGNPALRRNDLMEIMEDEDFDEDNFSLGLGSAKDFLIKDRMDHDACIECGRCEEQCPSVRAGDPFSPKRFIQTLRDYGHELLPIQEAEARKLLETAGEGVEPDGEDTEQDSEEVSGEVEELAPIVENKLDENFVWYCRTCRACVEVCPAKIDHVSQFVEIRRNEVMMQGRLPEEAQLPLKQLENNGNGFGNQDERVEWMEKAGFRIVAPEEEVDVLMYVGCLTSFDNTKQQIAQDMGRIMDAAGLSWGVMGEDETCCGDPARAMGNEMLYQETAKMQLEAIQERKFKVLLTTCPHCFHNLKNEYKTFGADLPVKHHTTFLQELIAEGRIQLSKQATGTITFHDPCYLGRYQGIYDAPRNVLQQIPGATITEMADNHEKSLCCGGGGGHFWMDFHAPKRINNLRMEQAMEIKADTVAVGCPYCMQMLADSVALLDLDEKVKITDMATLVLDAMDLPEAEAEAE